MMRTANPNPMGNSMSNPNPNQNVAAQAATQAAQAAIQAAKAKSQSAAATDEEFEEQTPGEADEQLAKAWGFSSKRPKISKEAVIGLIAIVALLGMFSYVVARHFKGRSTVTEKPKVDPEVKTASSTDPFENNQGKLNESLDEFENKAPTKSTNKKLDLDEGMLNLEDEQTEPPPTRVATKRQPLPVNLEDEFDTFGDNPNATPPARSKPAKVEEEAPEFVNEEPTPRTNRANVALDLEENTEPEQPALTKTTEPIRLKRPIQTEPAEEPQEFEKPVRTNVAQQIEDEFEVVPQRQKQPVRVAQKDAYTKKAAFDDPNTHTSPTTDLPPARERTTASKPTARHPLLKEGEYLVEEGDNFCVISKKVYGSDKYFLALAEHNRNRVADPCRMRPGLVISAPAKDLLEQQYSAQIPKPRSTSEAKNENSHVTQKVAAQLPTGLFQDANGAPWYRVGKDDTLTGIAKAHLGRVSRADQIFNLNRERLRNRDDLHPGQELRLPNDASHVRLDGADKSLR